MLMAENSVPIDDVCLSGDFVDAVEDELCIDMGTLMDILEEEKEPCRMQSSLEDVSLKNSSQEESTLEAENHDKLQLQSGYQDDFIDPVTSYPSYDLETSDPSVGGSGDYYTQVEPTEKMCSPVQTCSASLNDWFPRTSGTCPERVGKSQFETPGCSTASSFSEGDGNHFLYTRKNMGFQEDKAGIQFRLVGKQIDSKFVGASHSPSMENLDVEYCALRENRLGYLGRPESRVFTFLDVPLTDADVTSHNVASTDFTICHSSEVINDVDDHFYQMNSGNEFFEDPSGFHFQCLPNNEQITTNTKEQAEFPTESACSSSRMVLNAEGGTSNRSVSESPLIDYFDVNGQSCTREDGNNVAPIYRNSLSNIDIQSLGYSHSKFSSKKHLDYLKDEGSDELFTSGSMMSCSVDLIDEAVSRHSSYQNGSNYFPYEDKNQWFSGVPSSLSNQKHLAYAKEENDGMIIESKRDQQEIIDGISSRSPSDRGNLTLYLNTLDQHFPCSQVSVSSKKQLGCFKEEKEVELIKHRSLGSHVPKVSPESIQSNSLDCKSLVDDDSDVCILEDISQPACSNQSLVLGKSFATSQPASSDNSHVFVNLGVPSHHSSCSDTLNYTGGSYPGGGGMRHKACDERLIFQVALQDLSQPKSEASLPEGVLAVPLLRHQRIALSWMVQKETSGLHCSGGILADDQGLGKTISTIALILKERPQTFTGENASKCKLETLNLDDDDDNNNGVYDPDGIKQESDYSQVTSNGSSVRSLNSVEHAKGRPAAGTLVVCPTSVLRQWAEELRSKVTSKGNLSILVYHGSNRTKDPCEVAKYDVVITTYSIVSMEVPKQPLVDKEDDDEKIKAEGGDVPPLSFSGKKRKYPLTSDKKGLKHKKGVDGMLLEIASGPLARVGWFRVVLDEAQSIKNHRTQVARACWGLRAKRRWCLSGTPIQNAIDDLYSYFRFLRYDPFAVYKSFCATIKVPISKNPVKGYKKLQAVLKTIMLRRTKGTLLDGEPIINLPPKLIELKQVDFTKEERDFYNQLEIDSRDQFKEYAAAGTVRQNYVNILLMLLRLRQACDHPLLVKGFDSNPFLRSSVEMAKKLPQEKQMYRLNCFEGSSAICGICNDAPEDAVVSVCGHVFCNQCICEHLNGDDNQCPTTNCKARLNISSVFSKDTLDNCLAEQSGKDYSAGSVSDFVEALEPCSDGLWFNSSKIKAALEVLQSLTNSREPSSVNSSLQNTSDGSACFAEDSYDLHAKDSPNIVSDGKKLAAEKCLNDVIKVGGEKAIVFSQWTKMLDLLEASLKASSIQYRRLDGTMSVVAREKAVRDFNTLPEVSVMIMSLKAASLGLNMVAACRVLLLDLWWNPTTEDQAIDRAHRIGQTRPVTVLRLTVKNTVEDRILALQQKKREMVASAFGEDQNGGQQTRLTVEDLNYLFMV